MAWITVEWFFFFFNLSDNWEVVSHLFRILACFHNSGNTRAYWFLTSRGQRCTSGRVEATAGATRPHPRPKNAPAEGNKDSESIRLGPLSLCYDSHCSGKKKEDKIHVFLPFCPPPKAPFTILLLLYALFYSLRLLIVTPASSSSCYLRPWPQSPVCVCTQSQDTGAVTWLCALAAACA